MLGQFYMIIIPRLLCQNGFEIGKSMDRPVDPIQLFCQYRGRYPILISVRCTPSLFCEGIIEIHIIFLHYKCRCRQKMPKIADNIVPSINRSGCSSNLPVPAFLPSQDVDLSIHHRHPRPVAPLLHGGTHGPLVGLGVVPLHLVCVLNRGMPATCRSKRERIMSHSVVVKCIKSINFNVMPELGPCKNPLPITQIFPFREQEADPERGICMGATSVHTEVLGLYTCAISVPSPSSRTAPPRSKGETRVLGFLERCYINVLLFVLIKDETDLQVPGQIFVKLNSLSSPHLEQCMQNYYTFYVNIQHHVMRRSPHSVPVTQSKPSKATTAGLVRAILTDSMNCQVLVWGLQHSTESRRERPSQPPTANTYPSSVTRPGGKPHLN